MTRGLGLLAVLAAVVGRACDRSGGGGLPSTREAPSSAPVASKAVSASPAPTASAAASAGSRWTGTYKSAAGTLYIPPDWKSVRWSGADTQAGIGEGTMALDVDPATGRVAGTLEGPLGPASVDGVVSGGKLTASILRKDPSDRGFAGTLVGSVEPDRAAGTMNLSSAEANAIRAATFALGPAAH